MKFRTLVLELNLPQNFCHRHTDRLTDRQTDIFQKQSNRVQDIPKRENRKSKICSKPILSSTYIGKSKKSMVQ